LACCHDAGFIHRDIKPSNLMLAHADGPLSVKLIDFGLVRSSRQSQSSGEDSAGVGSPLYASPEQLREQPLDARSDLFSLGMSLWHLAIGRVPDSGTTRQIIERRLDTRSYAPDLPQSLPLGVRDVLAALLEKDPAGRPQSARELLQMLEAGAAKVGGSTPSVARPNAKPVAAQIEVLSVAQDLESDFEIVRSEGEQPTGVNYIAKRLLSHGEPVWLHAFHPRLWADPAFQSLAVQNIADTQGLDVQLLLRPLEVRAYRDYTVVISPVPLGGPLQGELKAVGKMAFSATSDLFGKIAVEIDRVAAVGLPAPDLRPSHIYCVRGGLTQKGALPLRLLPRYTENTVAGSSVAGADIDASATMAPESLTEGGGNELAAGPFARLIYRMTAGRDCVAAASLSVQAYVAVPELSEEGNRFLSRVIAGTMTPPSCSALLSTLLGTEGIYAAGVAQPMGSAVAANPAQKSQEAGKREPAPTPLAPKAREVPVTDPVPQPASALPVQKETPASVLSRKDPEAAFQPKAAVSQNKQAPAAPMDAGQRKVLIGSIVGVFGVGAAVFLFLAKPSQLPADAAVMFTGDLPAHSQFKVNSTLVTASHSGQAWGVPLKGGLSLPVSVVFEAAGYESVATEISKGSQLKSNTLIVPKRTRGSLVFRSKGPSDYDHFIVELEQALPEEAAAGLRTGERTGDSLRDLADSRVELPTGQYLLTLGGAPSVVSGLSLEQRLLVKAGEELVFSLPPSYSGKYRGEAEQGNMDLKIERDLRSGELAFELNGVQRNGKIRRSKLDNKGILNAEFLDAAGGIPSDLTAKLSADGKSLQVDLLSRGASGGLQSFQLRRVQ